MLPKKRKNLKDKGMCKNKRSDNQKEGTKILREFIQIKQKK